MTRPRAKKCGRKASPPPVVPSRGADEVRDELEYQGSQVRDGIADLGQRLDYLVALVKALAARG